MGNHLGNVLQVVTDRKLQVETAIGSGVLDYYSADVVSQSDYFPFGMLMANTNINPSTGLNIEEDDDYRFGFNGMEKDDEVKGGSNSYSSYFRQYDPRVARWLSLDPEMLKYPGQSPYVAFNNNPIFFLDPYGDDVLPPVLRKSNPGFKLLDPKAVRESLENNEGKYHISLGARIYSMQPLGSSIYSQGVGQNTRYFKAYFTPDVEMRTYMTEIKDGEGKSIGLEKTEKEYIDKQNGWITLVELDFTREIDFAHGSAAQASDKRGNILPVSALTEAHIELGMFHVGNFINADLERVQENVIRGAQANGGLADKNSFEITSVDIVINANAPESYKDALRKTLTDKFGADKVNFTESDLMRDSDLFEWDINFEYNLMDTDVVVDEL